MNELEYEKYVELLKLVSSLDKDWNGSDRAKNNLNSFLNKNKFEINQNYVKKASYFLNNDDELELHLFRYEIILELLDDFNKDERIFKVYKHTAPNGKVYIGITCSEDINTRWLDGYGYKRNAMFFNDIQEFGWKNIKHEILYEGKTAKEAQRIEKELILKYQSDNAEFGYNLDDGGRFAINMRPWKAWEYDFGYQIGAKSRPIKLIVGNNEFLKLHKKLCKYDLEIIYQHEIDSLSENIYVVITNPSFKEKRIKERLDKFFEEKNISDIEFKFIYGKVEDDAFVLKDNIIFINLYVVNNKQYKFEAVMEDFEKVLLNIIQ